MTILVTGATGNVGRHVVARLARVGESVRAVTRNPAAARFPDGVEVFRADLAQPESIVPAFDGVDRMYFLPLAYRTEVVRSFDDVVLTTEIVTLAEKNGVRRVVMLGSSDSDFASVEQAVEESGMDWTILRPGEFAVNKLDYWAPSIRSEGVVRAAYADAWGAPIHELDIADVAVAALLEDGHAGQHYELTGPAALTIREQVAAIASGIGREIRFEEISHAEARAELISHGMVPEVVDEMILWYPENYAFLKPKVFSAERVTGRPGRTLAEWAADHVEEFC